MKDLAVLEKAPQDAGNHATIPLNNIRSLQGFCGPLDRNLQILGDEFGITIRRLDCDLHVEGDPVRLRAALPKLAALAARARNSEALTDDDFTGLAGAPEGAGADMIVTRRRVIEPRTENQKHWVRGLRGNELAFGLGPAGTGKTYLAVAVGVSLLLERKVDKIILTRPAVEAGERLGFLPGDMKDKVDPYMTPIYDALADFLPAKQMAKYIEDKVIEIAPLAFMRGRTLRDAFVLLDEAQNTTAMQMKMFLTRLGQGSRMAITGDPRQIDLPRGVASGLVEAERILEGEPGISMTRFTSSDVVRHHLVARIIEAYDRETSSCRT